MAKLRIDHILVELGLAESRTQAQKLVMAGQVRVNGQIVQKSSALYPGDIKVEIEKPPRYVSRGGDNLESALFEFQVSVLEKVCTDIGSSTGGFTDCLLQHGARKVYAIDVGKGILHWKLRQDPRVVILESTNARYLDSLPESPDLITIDASFISLKLLLRVVKNWLSKKEGEIIALIKPQFEAGKLEAGRGGGVIKDPEIHRQVLSDVLGFAQTEGFGLCGLVRSPLMGPKGNLEFFLHLAYPEREQMDKRTLIDKVMEAS